MNAYSTVYTFAGKIDHAEKDPAMQNPNQLLRSMSTWQRFAAAVVSLLWLPLATSALAQTADVTQAASTAAAVIPQQVRYAGVMPNRGGDALEVTFKIYATAEGGEALWTETQQVAVSPDGTYSVLLGAASEGGLPQTVFAAGQARWVGVSIDRAEGTPRTPLTSVAYAMKAGDAESVGGLAVTSLATKDDLAQLRQTVATAVVAQPQVQVQPEAAPTGSGTADYVPLWTAAGTLGNSNIFQGSTGYIGIGTTTPGGPLEVSTGALGGANATMMLQQTSAASGNYYADIGLYNSNGLIGNLSALGAGYPAGNLFGANDVVFLGGQQNASTNLIMLTNTSGAIKFGTGGFAKTNERLRIGATGGVSIGNGYVGTDPGAGNLIVSGNTGIGTAMPAATLEVNGTAKFDGLMTFAAGQTFPGAVTGITATSPLTSSGMGAVTVGLNTSALEMTLNGVYAQLGVSDTFTKGIVGQVTTASGVGVMGTGTNGATGVEGTSDSGYGVEGVSTSGSGVYGISTSGNAGYFANASAANTTIYATNSANYVSGGAVPAALYATSTGTSSVGAYGQGTVAGVEGYTHGTGGYGVIGQGEDVYGGFFANNGTDYAALYAANNAAGTSSTRPISIEASAQGINAYGVYSLVTGNGATSLYGESDGAYETGASRTPVGVKGLATGADGNGLVGDATGTGGYGLYAHASGGADSTRYASAGVYALADSGDGVEGFAVGQSDTYNNLQEFTAAIWGDTASRSALGGIVGTTDDNNAGFFVNDSKTMSTLAVVNDASGGTTGLYKTFKASTSTGSCGIGDGDFSCTGQLKTLAMTGGGAHTVETYTMQSPENWMEDFGTGTMKRGVGIVQIEPAFADTVTADASYHVFLTPRGDSKGLYVTHVTASSFEVHEAGGGSSSIGFDYRIVAKRRGYEAQRLVDVTDRYKAELASTQRRMPHGDVVPTKRVAEAEMVERPAGVGNAAKASATIRSLRPGGGAGAMHAPAVQQGPASSQKPTEKPVAPR